MPVVNELLTQLGGLSEKTRRNKDPYGHLFCNEAGLSLSVPLLERRRQEAQGGIGLVIGTGGIFSLLPSLGLDGVIMVDINPAVLEFSQHVGEAIKNTQTPWQAEGVIFDYDSPGNFPAQMNIKNRELYVHSFFETKFTDEVRNFGKYHWRNLGRFPLAKKKTEETPIVYVTADVTNPLFGQRLGNALSHFGQTLSYVNFSNIHHFPKSLDFVDNLPVQESTTIQFSSFEGVAIEMDCPRVHIAASMEDYKARTSKDR